MCSTNINSKNQFFARTKNRFRSTTNQIKPKSDTSVVSPKIPKLTTNISLGAVRRQSTATTNTATVDSHKYQQLFSKSTKAIVWGMQTRAVQSMLDFDFICR